MKRIYIVICIALLSFMTSYKAYSQENRTKGNVDVKVNYIQHKNDSLYLDMQLSKTGKNATCTKSVNFIPVIVAKDYEKRLPAIMLKGRRNYKSYKRSISLLTKKQLENYNESAPYCVIKDYDNTTRVIDYPVAIPYQEWMNNYDLVI